MVSNAFLVRDVCAVRLRRACRQRRGACAQRQRRHSCSSAGLFFSKRRSFFSDRADSKRCRRRSAPSRPVRSRPRSASRAASTLCAPSTKFCTASLAVSCSWCSDQLELFISF
eukprot:4820341-Pleurochrysis_carterae.AAC.1